MKLATSTFMSVVFCVLAVILSPAQTFSTVASFDGNNGAFPQLMSLIQSTSGGFYGTTVGGSAGGGCGIYDGCGTVFKASAGGDLTAVYSWGNGSHGGLPFSTLVQTSGGAFYGTASGGYGSVFKLTPDGALATLYDFCSLTNCTDGELPLAGLTQARNGDFYGTTTIGGAYGYGTIFKITPEGALATIHSFDNSDGGNPYAPLVQGSNGEFYGTTYGGGTYGYGTVFKITAAGNLTSLHAFDQSDGANPIAGLIQGSDGNFYGTTGQGGVNSPECNGYGCGTVFKITPSGVLTTLYDFCSLRGSGCTDGAQTEAGLIQGTDGNLYGATANGGANNYGTVFQITPQGNLTTLYNFCAESNCADGANPLGGLSQMTYGNFYGTTFYGGTGDCNSGCGTVFSISMGLGPFAETRPTSGKVGAKVIILGNKLKGTTGVTFNGTPAVFDVVSNSEITTNVPSDATTGTVQVTTPSGTLNSNTPFQVIQ
jgi:uncharacterized repeat protein (TIGR03803 family)